MNGLYSFIRRQRRPLTTATLPAETPVSACPHCGRRADEPVAATQPPAENSQPPTSDIERPVNGTTLKRKVKNAIAPQN